MTTKFNLLSGIRTGKYYKIITFYQGVQYYDIMMGVIDNKKIHETNTLGKLIEINQYDRNIVLIFEDSKGNKLEYEPFFGYVEGFVEYEPDTEARSMERIQHRTSLLKEEIKGNNWALRPENVLATQEIDLSNWAEGSLKNFL
jgi:hypothetical protein